MVEERTIQSVESEVAPYIGKAATSGGRRLNRAEFTLAAAEHQGECHTRHDRSKPWGASETDSGSAGRLLGIAHSALKVSWWRIAFFAHA
jgi:hypothetical protein